jgi:hypothetical protein
MVIFHLGSPNCKKRRETNMEPSHNLDLHQATLGAIGAIGATILINLLPNFKVL